MPLSSGSGWSGGSYGSWTRGPAGGSWAMPGGEGGFNPWELAQSLINERLGAAAQRRSMEAEAHEQEMDERREAKRERGRTRKRQKKGRNLAMARGIPGISMLHRGPDYGQSRMAEELRRRQVGDEQEQRRMAYAAMLMAP